MVNRRRTNGEWTSDDFLRAVDDLNPWHTTGEVPDVWAKPVERPLAKFLWRRLYEDKPRRFQIVLGPRRVGKSTAMYQTVQNLLDTSIPPTKLWWLKLDHPLLINVPLDRLVEFACDKAKASAKNPAYLFLDELTYATDWDLWLKEFYDSSWSVRIVGTSSSTAALRARKPESGVGRWEEQYLAPYLFQEYLELLEEAPIQVPVEQTLFDTIAEIVASKALQAYPLGDRRRRLMLIGGFPELLQLGIDDPELDETSALLQSQRILKSEAIERAIYKDIPQVFGVASPLQLERLFCTLAGQAAGLLSPQTICKNLGNMSQPTFDKYLSYLERSYLVFTLQNYSGSEASKQKRGRKLFFVDGAVRNAALQRGVSPLSNEPELGLLLENMVASHLHSLSQQTQVRLYHWRDGDDEVDLIYDHPEKPLAIEVGSSSHHRRGLLAFAERYPRFQGRCFVVTPTSPARMPAVGTIDEVGSIPLDLFLLAVSAQAEKSLEGNLFARPTQA